MIKKTICILALLLSLALFVTAAEQTEALVSDEGTLTEETAPEIPGQRSDMARPEGFERIPPQMPGTRMQNGENAEQGQQGTFQGGNRGGRTQYGGQELPEGTIPTEFQGGMGGGGMNRFPFEQQQMTDADNQGASLVSQQGTKNVSDIIKENFTPIFSMVLLAAAFVFVIFYKRKQF